LTVTVCDGELEGTDVLIIEVLPIPPEAPERRLPVGCISVVLMVIVLATFVAYNQWTKREWEDRVSELDG
jgi:hypothetical protein